MPAGVDRTLIMEMSTQVDLGFLQPSGNLLFKGNHLTGLPNLGTGAFFGTAVTISAVGGFTVEDNVFEKNDSGSLLSVASYSSAAIRGNHFRGPDPTTEGSGGAHTALTLGAEDDSKPTTVVVADNLFKDFMHNQYGPTVVMMYQHDDFDCRFTGNLFWAARMVRIFPGAGAVAKRLEFSDNELWGTILTVGAADELIIDSNQLSGFLLAVQGQPKGAAATIANNLLNAGIVEIQNPQGSLAITRNEISKAYGVGLAVASAGGSTPGPAGEPPGVTIQRNLFNNTTEDTWASGPVGKIGDGLQVTGTAEHPCSSVRILGNRFQDCARSGAIVSSATATVEGNMFPTGCPLVVQNEVTAGAVSGADSLFAEHPETPLGVVTLDYMSYME